MAATAADASAAAATCRAAVTARQGTSGGGARAAGTAAAAVAAAAVAVAAPTMVISAIARRRQQPAMMVARRERVGRSGGGGGLRWAGDVGQRKPGNERSRWRRHGGKEMGLGGVPDPALPARQPSARRRPGRRVAVPCSVVQKALNGRRGSARGGRRRSPSGALPRAWGGRRSRGASPRGGKACFATEGAADRGCSPRSGAGSPPHPPREHHHAPYGLGGAGRRLAGHAGPARPGTSQCRAAGR